MRDAWHVQRLTWFSKGFYVVGLEDERIVVRDLRMGLEPDHYAFSFAVAQRNGNAIVAMAPERVAAAPYRSEDWLTLRDNVLGRKAGP